MLPQSFLEWWFEPWRYAAANQDCMADVKDVYARRDGYRIWCQQAGVTPELPPRFDPGWCVAANGSPASIMGAAYLFGGLILTRNRDLDCLRFFTPAERKWCLSIAATQPLQPLSGLFVQSREAARLCGLLELAIRLEIGFPGMWSRLRLMLPGTLAQETASLLEDAATDRTGVQSPNARPQRCWRMCLARADAIG